MKQGNLLCNGLRISFDRSGSEHDATLLLLHAGGESRQVWQAVIQQLSLKDWQIIAPDFRGHGASGRAENYYFADFVSDIQALVKVLAARPLVIVGSSIGGLVGLMLAGSDKVTVDGLMLLDAPTRLCLESTRRESQKVVNGINSGVDQLAHIDPKLASNTLVEDILAQPQILTEAARRITIPTRLLVGKRSQAMGEVQCEHFRKDIPHSEIFSVDTGHLIARDRPDIVADQIREFVKIIESTMTVQQQTLNVMKM